MSIVEQKTQKVEVKNTSTPVQKPNESGVLRVEDCIRITDPNTKEVLVQGRG